jgi:hypothetical protein
MKTLTVKFNEIQRFAALNGGYTIEQITAMLISQVEEYNKTVLIDKPDYKTLIIRQKELI